jgi:hypothetical protein
MIPALKRLLDRLSSKKSDKAATVAQAAQINPPVGPLNDKPELEDARRTKEKGWIGVDLDGTLAHFDVWRGIEYIGKPVPGIKARVLEWIAQGYNVKVFTARASVPEGIEPIKLWLATNGFPPLEVTCTKDFHMIELWDDRAVQVVSNTGSPVLSARWGATPRAPLFGIERNAKRAAGSTPKPAPSPKAGTQHTGSAE